MSLKIKYLSYENFSNQDIEEFIKKCTKKSLLMAIQDNKKYIRKPMIAGFRLQNIPIERLQKLYLDELLKNPETSFLGSSLLMQIDLHMKKELSSEQYELLQEKTYTIEQLKEIIDQSKILNVISAKYLKMFLALDENQASEIVEDDEVKKDGEIDKQELKKELDECKLENKKLLKQIKGIEKNLENITKENNRLKQHSKAFKTISLENIITKSKDRITYDDLKAFIIQHEQDLIDFNKLEDKIHDLKLKYLNDNNYEEVLKLIFIEYVLMASKGEFYE